MGNIYSPPPDFFWGKRGGESNSELGQHKNLVLGRQCLSQKKNALTFLDSTKRYQQNLK